MWIGDGLVGMDHFVYGMRTGIVGVWSRVWDCTEVRAGGTCGLVFADRLRVKGKVCGVFEN